MPARPEPPQLWRSVFYPLPDYKYFAKPPDFATSPKIGELNLLKAAWMADFVALTTPEHPFSTATESRIAARGAIRAKGVCP